MTEAIHPELVNSAISRWATNLWYSTLDENISNDEMLQKMADEFIPTDNKKTFTGKFHRAIFNGYEQMVFRISRSPKHLDALYSNTFVYKWKALGWRDDYQKNYDRLTQQLAIALKENDALFVTEHFPFSLSLEDEENLVKGLELMNLESSKIDAETVKKLIRQGTKHKERFSYSFK